MVEMADDGKVSRQRNAVWLAASAVGVALALPGCTRLSNPPPPDGVLTGTARACVGAALDMPLANLTVYRGAIVVATQRVPDNGTYHFVLVPGHYVVSNTGSPQGGHVVSVPSGGTVHVNVPNECK